MNPYQILAVFFVGSFLSVAVVSLMNSLGVPLLMSIGFVYLFALWFMGSLQRRAMSSLEADQADSVSGSHCTHHQVQEDITREAREIRRNIISRSIPQSARRALVSPS